MMTFVIIISFQDINMYHVTWQLYSKFIIKTKNTKWNMQSSITDLSLLLIIFKLLCAFCGRKWHNRDWNSSASNRKLQTFVKQLRKMDINPAFKVNKDSFVLYLFSLGRGEMGEGDYCIVCHFLLLHCLSSDVRLLIIPLVSFAILLFEAIKPKGLNGIAKYRLRSRSPLVPEGEVPA